MQSCYWLIFMGATRGSKAIVFDTVLLLACAYG
jgi:hypothetical protein